MNINEVILMRKKLFLNKSELVKAYQLNENWQNDWDVKSGDWYYENGWIFGRHPDNSPGMIVSNQDFFGDIMVSFTAKTVLPSTHDINFMWHGTWDEQKDSRGVAYVAGLAGWWENKIGFERSPDYKLNVGTKLLDFVPGREYNICGGDINGHIFVLIDGKLALEITDPDPIDGNIFGKIGFEAYCSHIQIKDIEVNKICWEEIESSYICNF